MAEHGTQSGYRSGCRCDRCREAHRVACLEGRRRAGIPEFRPAECGTVGGYRAHLRRRETPCPECRAARTRYVREQRKGLHVSSVLRVRPPGWDGSCMICGRAVRAHTAMCWRYAG